MTRRSRGDSILATTKANQVAAQRRRTEERVRQLSAEGAASELLSVVVAPSSSTTGVWESVQLGPQHFVWSRTLIGGVEEFFTASLTREGHWELRHSSQYVAPVALFCECPLHHR